MIEYILKFSIYLILPLSCLSLKAQTVQYIMPEETNEHEGTWLQWPHNDLYGPWYIDDIEPTFVAMTNALQSGENVHIIAKDSTELSRVINVLNSTGVPLGNIDFYVHPTDDIWSRDNGPMFVYDQNDNISIIDWGFNGWGLDTPYSNCDIIPESVGGDLGIPVIDLNGVVLEGGAIEHDGNGTMIATRSSITHTSRNPNLSEAQIEDSITRYMGITKFIWLDGVYGLEITDMHIDGFVKFANDTTIVTMDSTDLLYWDVIGADINTLYNATNNGGDAYNYVTLPLTQNNVVTSYNDNLGYKVSYVNYYIGNDVVLMPTYNDPMDASALAILQAVYPNRTVVGVDVRNLYAYGGMIHCVTQQQPVDLNAIGLNELDLNQFRFYPNPSEDYTMIKYSIQSNQLLTIEVYNSLGQLVKTVAQNSNKNKIKINNAGINSGVYYYNLLINGLKVHTQKIIINRK